MKTHLARALGFTLMMMVLVGLGYPLLGVAVSDVAFHRQANGSITKNGSSLIGQPWTTASGTINPRWFQGRPDADNPLYLKVGGKWTPGSSGASNLGPHSAVLVAQVRALAREWRTFGVNPTPDLVTTSGSGLDPDISQLDAMVQVPMVAKARDLPASQLVALIKHDTHAAQWGFLGASYVNVLTLNEGVAALAHADAR